jgi:hypothetical protein
MSKGVANTLGSPQKIYSSFNGYSGSKKKNGNFQKKGKKKCENFTFSRMAKSESGKLVSLSRIGRLRLRTLWLEVASETI